MRPDRFVMWLVGLFASSLALYCGWGWFLVPLGLPAITFWHAMGLGLFSALFLHARTQREMEDMEATEPMYFLSGQVVVPLLQLVAMWLASLLV